MRIFLMQHSTGCLPRGPPWHLDPRPECEPVSHLIKDTACYSFQIVEQRHVSLKDPWHLSDVYRGKINNNHSQ